LISRPPAPLTVWPVRVVPGVVPFARSTSSQHRPCVANVRYVTDSSPALRRLLDDARAEADAGDRARRRWLRQQAEEEAEFTGTLRMLFEREATVVVATETGRRHQGRLVGLGRDVCSLDTPEGRRVWLRLDAVTTIRAEQALDHAAAGDARAQRQDLDFAEVLTRLAEERPAAQLVVHGSTSITGELRAVGADVATVLEGETRTVCYVRVPSVVEVSVFGSG
jgi:hypothetical protein